MQQKLRSLLLWNNTEQPVTFWQPLRWIETACRQEWWQTGIEIVVCPHQRFLFWFAHWPAGVSMQYGVLECWTQTSILALTGHICTICLFWCQQQWCICLCICVFAFVFMCICVFLKPSHTVHLIPALVLYRREVPAVHRDYGSQQTRDISQKGISLLVCLPPLFVNL